MKKPTKRKAAEVVEQVEQPAGDAVMLKVVRPVDGKEVGETFAGRLNDYRLQIKHGSIEVI
jgi:ribosomal protein S6E (S10)